MSSFRNALSPVLKYTVGPRSKMYPVRPFEDAAELIEVILMGDINQMGARAASSRAPARMEPFVLLRFARQNGSLYATNSVTVSFKFGTSCQNELITAFNVSAESIRSFIVMSHSGPVKQ